MNLFFPRGDFLRAIAIPPDKFLLSPASLLENRDRHQGHHYSEVVEQEVPVPVFGADISSADSYQGDKTAIL
jgi:hypothetical protein